MSLEKATITWNAKQLKGMVMNGKIDFNHIVQRSYVWERARKSALIESMIIGYPIPAVFAKRVEDDSEKRSNNIYCIMDGKQRLSTVKEYLNDEFALTDLAPVTYFDDEANEECHQNISSLKFSELPEALQNHLSTINFSITYFDNLTKEEERELFKRLNAGKPLSVKSRILASCKDIEGLLDIGSHKLFNEMMTDKARDNKNQIAVVMKAWCMLNKNINDVSFESKVLNPMLEETEITEAEKLIMIDVFNMIVNVHSVLIERKNKRVAKKLYTETHMVSLVPYFHKAIESGIDEEMMADWLVEFFGTKDTASVSEKYNDSCVGGSAKNVNIIARNDALDESYAEFFKTDEEYMSEDEDDDFTYDNEADNEVEEEEYGEDVEESGEYKSIVDEILADMEYDDHDE